MRFYEQSKRSKKGYMVKVENTKMDSQWACTYDMKQTRVLSTKPG